MFRHCFLTITCRKRNLLKQELQTIYPLSSALLPKGFNCADPEILPQYLKENPGLCGGNRYLPDLATIELAVHKILLKPVCEPEKIKERMVRPGLDLLKVSWQGLADIFNGGNVTPVSGDSFVLLLPEKDCSRVRVVSPSNYDLLALKIVAENIDSKTAADEAHVSIGHIDNILYSAGQKGLLLFPPSNIIRPKDFCREDVVTGELCSSPSFTLQWHITQACNLHCRHCYDRSDRTTMTVEQGLSVLDDLYRFCQEHNVYGQVSFTGGNPLLYPHFLTLYEAAAKRGFLTGILGNPMDRAYIEDIVAIQMPEFYQVSLEGLKEHNDYIRGPGHFEQTIHFLELLKELNISSMVMLTLTRANMEQVLDLANILRDKTDLFTFNRLAMVGEGAQLASVESAQYQDFLKSYINAAIENKTIHLKDNLCNLELYKQGAPLQGGCAGVGCGAAFNFVSLLPDGEVHACRKLPSLLGNIYKESLTDIYHTSLAERYRLGSSACSGCEIRPACGGCPAVSFGFGQDIFNDLDPYCFKESLQ
ncbi:MAG: selenobiotic family peptide radical SAM maturase [Desulforhopalus sp.]